VIDGRGSMLIHRVGRPRVRVSEARVIGTDVARVQARGRIEKGFVVSHFRREMGRRRNGGLDSFGEIKGIVEVATVIEPTGRAPSHLQGQGLLHTAVKRDRESSHIDVLLDRSILTRDCGNRFRGRDGRSRPEGLGVRCRCLTRFFFCLTHLLQSLLELLHPRRWSWWIVDTSKFASGTLIARWFHSGTSLLSALPSYPHSAGGNTARPCHSFGP